MDAKNVSLPSINKIVMDLDNIDNYDKIQGFKNFECRCIPLKTQ